MKLITIQRLINLGAEETEEGRTAAHTAVKAIKAKGYVVVDPKVTPVGNQGGEAPSMGGPVDQVWLANNVPRIMKGGILVMGMGATVSIEAMIQGYERRFGSVPYATRRILESRLLYRMNTFKGKGYLDTKRGRFGGYKLAEGVRVTGDGEFVLV